MKRPDLPLQGCVQSEALIFDCEVADVYTLVASVGPEVRAVRAVAGKVASQIGDLLASGVSTIHVLGHGKPGQVELAGFVLDELAWESIVDHAQTQSIETGSSKSRSENVDEGAINHKLEINFWSCQTGDGVMGKNYTQRVANLCNANVNASSGLIGHEKLGGSWELDVMSYPKVPFSQPARDGFEQVLANDMNNGGSGHNSGTPISINQGDLGALDPQYNYSVAQVDLTRIVELANSPYVSSISLASSLVGEPQNVNAAEFAALTDDKVQEFTGDIHVSDTAAAFLEAFDAEDLNAIAQYAADNPSETLPVFSADLDDAKPIEAGVLRALTEQASSLGVQVGNLDVTMAAALSAESLQGLSVNEAVAVIEASGETYIGDITIADTAEEILGNAAYFDAGGLLAALSPDEVTAENVSGEDINDVAEATVNSHALIGSIEMSNVGAQASPVDVATALNLLDARVVNGPAASELSIEDTASDIIASLSNFQTGGDLESVAEVKATDVSVAQLSNLVSHTFIDDVAISDSLTALNSLSYGGPQADRPDIVPVEMNFSVHVEGASVDSILNTSVPHTSYDVFDSVENIISSYRIDPNGIVAGAGSMEINGGSNAPISLQEMAFLAERVTSFPDNISMDVADTANTLSLGLIQPIRRRGLLFMTLISLL